MKNRLVWLDAAKTIAILSVVLGHSYLFGNPIHSFVYSFHIPLFFILSGYTCKVIKPSPRKLVSRILAPYLAICLYVFFKQIISFGTDGLFKLLLSFIWASGGQVKVLDIPSVGLAWFLMALFISKIIYPYVKLFFNEIRLSVISQFVIFLLIAVLSWLISQWFLFPFAFNQALVAMFYLFIGQTLHQFIEKHDKGFGLNKYVAALVIFCVIWFSCISNGIFYSIGNMFHVGPLLLGILMSVSGPIVFILLLQKTEYFLNRFKICRSFAMVGRDSLLILSLHQIESSSIDWLSISFDSLGMFSSVFVGFLHVLLVLSMYLIILASIPRIRKS